MNFQCNILISSHFLSGTRCSGPNRCPRNFRLIFERFSGVKRTTDIHHFARKPDHESSGFLNDRRGICAYSIGLNQLLADNTMLARKIWRLPEVLNQTGLSRSTIYELIGRGELPRQIDLGPRAVGWVAEDVLAWTDSKISEARQGNPHSN